MEAAVAEGPAAQRVATPGARPPHVPLPRALQTARFLARPIPFYEEWRGRLGDTFSARLLGPGDVVFLSDPESVKLLFTSDRINTIAPGRNIVLRPLLGPQSLLLQEGAEHLRRRKLMLPPFHGERMRAYESTIAEVAAAEIASWPTGTPFPVHASMQAITLEVIMRAVFGVTDPERRESMRDGLLAVLTESASPAAFGLTMPLVKELPHYRRFAARVARTDALLAAEIADRRADPELDSRDDILSMLVSAEFDDGSKMSDSELRDQLLTLLLAGHETTATALAWAFDLLLHTPPTLERLVAELEAGEIGLPRRGDRRVAAGPPRGAHDRAPAAPARDPRRLRARGGRGRVRRDLHAAHQPRGLSGPVRVSGPSASSMTARRPTPGSRSAAAPAGASAPRSPSSSCASSCARS